MSKMYEVIASLCEAHGISGYRLCRDAGIQPSLLTELKMGRQKSLSAANAQKIANYFGVSVGYLLGEEEKENVPATNDRHVTDEDIKFALFGGSEDITDAMYEEVKSFAAYIKSRGVKEAK